MPAKSVRLGPGEFTFGDTGTPMDASCQLANGVVSWDKDAEDPITVLCGDTVPGSVTYSSAMSGNLLQDLTEEDGLVAYTWEHKGEAVPFTFTPNTAAGATVSGTIVIDPLDVGSEDDYGAVMTSDFEWDIVGTPTLSWGTPPEPEALEAEPRARTGLIMAADRIQVKGADRVAATLRSAANKIENMDAADRRVAARLAQSARQQAPKRTGRLARSTVGIPSPEGGARVQATVIYAGVIHNGWRRHHITPNPFIRDAVEAGVPQATSTYAQEVQQALNTVKGA